MLFHQAYTGEKWQYASNWISRNEAWYFQFLTELDKRQTGYQIIWF